MTKSLSLLFSNYVCVCVYVTNMFGEKQYQKPEKKKIASLWTSALHTKFPAPVGSNNQPD